MNISRLFNKITGLFIVTGLVCCTLVFHRAEAVSTEKTVRTLSTAEQLTRELDDMVHTDEFYKVPGIGVIVYKDGKEVYSHFAGRAYIDDDDPANDRPITRDTRFRIASISKQFTAITVMQLVEKGKIDLDADASEYLGFALRNPNFPDTPITVRMLLAHTSSIRDGNCYALPLNLSLKECFFPKGKFWEEGAHFSAKNEPPAEHYCYSNLNYVLLGAIIESVTGERFDKYQKKHILKQLNTKASYLVGDLSKKEFKNLGVIYQKSDNHGVWNERGPWYTKCDDYTDGLPEKHVIKTINCFGILFDCKDRLMSTYSLVDYQIGKNPSLLGPQGGLRISLPELGNMLQMFGNNGRFENKQVLSEKSVREMTSPQWTYDEKIKNGDTYGGALLKYGLGMILIDGDKMARGCQKYQVDLVGHTGECYGLLAGAFRFADKPRNGFVFVVNGEAVEEDDDPRSSGKFSGNYIWEEMIMDAVIRAMVEDKN